MTQLACVRRGLVVAILGAESTGKTTLAHALCASLTSAGEDVVVVDETLRRFCDEQGRVPRMDEQAGIAGLHAGRIEDAARHHGLVIADTTGLQTAVYSDWVFGDTSLYEEAAADHRRRIDLTLLTALDLPWVADGLQRDGPHVHEPIDILIRQALRRGGIEYAVVVGQGERRTAPALAAVRRLLVAREARAPAHDQPDPDGAPAAGDRGAAGMSTGAPIDDRPAGDRPNRWRSACERCGDPDCERHILAALRRVAGDAVPPGPPRLN